jgi:hypothetical protein
MVGAVCPHFKLLRLTSSASPKHFDTIRRNGPSRPRKPSVSANKSAAPLAHYFPTRSSSESISAPPATVPIQSGAVGVVGKNQHVSEVLNRAKEDAGESWDDDFAADITLSKLNRKSV